MLPTARTTPDRVLNIDEVIYRTTYSRSSINRLIAQGKFPKQVKYGPQKMGWPESVINDFVARGAESLIDSSQTAK